MKKFLILLSLVCSIVYGQDVNPSITPEGVKEVIRRGNHVELIDGTQSDPIGDTMSPPADDSHKWFISVITQANCKYCDQLKYDFANEKNLQAWVDTTSPSKSFVHYNVYRLEDKTQVTWRFKNIKFKGVPTIIIQPPLNGDYGSPSTIVAQYTGYSGDAKSLSNKISNSITTYVKTLNRRSDNDKEIKSNIEGYRQSEGLGQRQPRPEFLPPDIDNPVRPNVPNDLIPPELEGLKPKIPSLPHFPSLEGSPFLLVLGGLYQVFMGVISLVFGGIQTILLFVILGMLVVHLYGKRSKNVEKDQSKTSP